MELSEISIAGIIAVLLMFGLSMAVHGITDRLFLRTALRTHVLWAVQLAVLLLVTLLLAGMDAWWLDALWLLLMTVGVTLLGLRSVRLPWRLFGRSLLLSVLVTLLVSSLLLLWCFPGRWFVPLTGVVCGYLYVSSSRSLHAYVHALRHTESHRRYLMANGATPLESSMPCVRRSLRASVASLLSLLRGPQVVVMPLLFCGLLMGGLTPTTAILSVLIVMAVVYMSSVLSSVLTVVFLTFFRQTWASWLTDSADRP